MYLESFRHIIEIEALKKQNAENLKHISSENKRISDLVERRNRSMETIKILEQKIHSLKLQELQSRAEQLQVRESKLLSQLNLAVTEKEQLAFESQILSSKNEREAIEEEYFLKLEQQENLEREIQELKEFIAGSEMTLKDIKNEVQTQVLKEEEIIKGRQLRINSLMDLLHSSARTLYIDCEQRLAGKKAVAFLLDRKCSECHMLLDYNLKSSLELGHSLEACPHCGRFLVPDSARLY